MAGATRAVQAGKENKVEFGLRNCYYAVITEGEDGKITYGSPKRLPGAVSITFDKSGDLIRFKADDIDYYTNANNQGYEGTLTLARVPEEFRTEVLKEEKTEKGVILENSDAQVANIALMFEFQGDVKATRHLFYYCSVNRPSVGSVDQHIIIWHFRRIKLCRNNAGIFHPRTPGILVITVIEKIITVITRLKMGYFNFPDSANYGIK